MPNIVQSLYWRNSSLTYTVPLPAGSLLAGVALAFLAGGFDEIYTALQCAQILGYRLDQATVRAGGALSVTVYWQPADNTNRPYTVFAHLYSAAGGSLGQVDGYPGQGQYLTTVWIHGQPFADQYQIPVRADAPAGPAMIILGLYDEPTGQRLPVSGADAGPGAQSWVQFGSIHVTR